MSTHPPTWPGAWVNGVLLEVLQLCDPAQPVVVAKDLARGAVPQHRPPVGVGAHQRRGVHGGPVPRREPEAAAVQHAPAEPHRAAVALLQRLQPLLAVQPLAACRLVHQARRARRPQAHQRAALSRVKDYKIAHVYCSGGAPGAARLSKGVWFGRKCAREGQAPAAAAPLLTLSALNLSCSLQRLKALAGSPAAFSSAKAASALASSSSRM